MGIVRVRLEDLPPLSEEDIAELRESYEKFADKEIDDPDCPPMTDEELDRMDRIMKRHNTRRITKEMILEDRRLQAAKNL